MVDVECELLSGACLPVKVGVMGNGDREQNRAAFLSDMENSPLSSHSLLQFNAEGRAAEHRAELFDV